MTELGVRLEKGVGFQLLTKQRQNFFKKILNTHFLMLNESLNHTH